MPQGSLTVITQNAWGRAPFWDQRCQALAQTLRALRPDVIGLQEICTRKPGTQSQAHDLAAAMGDYDAWYLPARKRPDGFSEGVAFLVRQGVDIVGRRDLALSLNSHDPLEGQRRRVVLAMTVRLPSAIVEVMVTHLSLSRDARERTIPELLMFAQDHGKGDVDGAIVMGDLNATPEEPTLDDFVEEGWYDAWSAANHGNGGTFPAAMPLRRIDYIWVRPGSRWTIAGCERTKLTGSDHLGVCARIEWPGSGDDR